jgi:hypothetical protein
MSLVIRPLKKAYIRDWASMEPSARAVRESMLALQQLMETAGLRPEDLWMAFEEKSSLARLMWLSDGDQKRSLLRFDFAWDGPWLGLARRLLEDSIQAEPSMIHEIRFMRALAERTPKHTSTFMPPAQAKRLQAILPDISFKKMDDLSEWSLHLRDLSAQESSSAVRMIGDEVHLLDSSNGTLLAARLDGMDGAYLCQNHLDAKPGGVLEWLWKLKQLGALQVVGEGRVQDNHRLEESLEELALAHSLRYDRWEADLWQRALQAKEEDLKS